MTRIRRSSVQLSSRIRRRLRESRITRIENRTQSTSSRAKARFPVSGKISPVRKQLSPPARLQRRPVPTDHASTHREVPRYTTPIEILEMFSGSHPVVEYVYVDEDTYLVVRRRL